MSQSKAAEVRQAYSVKTDADAEFHLVAQPGGRRVKVRIVYDPEKVAGFELVPRSGGTAVA